MIKSLLIIITLDEEDKSIDGDRNMVVIFDRQTQYAPTEVVSSKQQRRRWGYHILPRHLIDLKLTGFQNDESALSWKDADQLFNTLG